MVSGGENIKMGETEKQAIGISVKKFDEWWVMGLSATRKQW